MSFFSTRKKKPENIKCLTETEIQQRLYGHLRTPSTSVEDSESETQRPPVATQRRLSELSKNAAVSKTGCPPSEVLKTQETSGVQKTSSTAVSHFSQKPGWNDSASAAGASFQPKSKKPALLMTILKRAGALLKNILFFVFGLVFKLTAAIFRVLLSVNFRKPSMKRFASLLGAAAFIGLLFLSTHFLNVRRETAMKHPRRQVVAERKPVPQPASENSSEELSSEDPDAEPDDDSADSDTAGVEEVDEESAQNVNPAAPASPKPVLQSIFTIQIATFAVEEDAARLVMRLKEQGADAFLKGLERPGGRTYYCVFVGRYKDSRQGEENLTRFKKMPVARPFQDAFVRALKTES